MNLYHASAKTSSILNNTWSHSSGQVIYKVHTPSKLNRITKIYRVAPSSPSGSRTAPSNLLSSSDVQPDLREWKSQDSVHPEEHSLVESDDASENELDFRDNFVMLGEIDWKLVKSTVLKWDGREVLSSTFFRKEGWGWYGRHRVFVGPDGREFKWILGASVPELILNDGSKTLIARFHRRSLGLFGTKGPRPAYLEIVPGYESMADLIFFTFVYIEKIRKDKERAAQSGGG